jgi:hypothetical protein
MKKISTSNIVENIRRQPFTKASIDHIQEAFQEPIAEILKTLTGSAAGVIVLNGLVDQDSGSDYDITAGSVFYNGEVYKVDAFAGTPPGGQVPVLVLETTYHADDPVRFTDNNEYNVHEIRKLKLQFGASGSGISNFNTLKRFFDELGELFTSGIKTDNIKLKYTTVTIPVWDMDANADYELDLGIAHSAIRRITVLITPDTLEGSGNRRYQLPYHDSAGTLDAWHSEVYQVIGVTAKITIYRRTGGVFDSTDFNGAGGFPTSSRGIVLIEHT